MLTEPGNSNPSISGEMSVTQTSVQRFQLHDGRPVIGPHPEGNRSRGVVDEYPPDVREPRQEILDKLAGTRIQALDRICELSSGPRFPILIARHIVRPRTWRRRRPLLELLGLGVEHPDAVPAVFAKPQPPLPVEHAPAGSGSGRRRLAQRNLTRARINLADILLSQNREVDIVLRI